MPTSRIGRIPTHAEVASAPQVLTAFNDDVVAEFRANGGRVGGPFADSRVLLLTMTGAKSGGQRTTPLEYVTIDDRVLVLGTYGGAPKDPAWVANLRAHPRARVEMGSDAHDVTTHELLDGERAAMFAKVVESLPRAGTYPRTARPIPIFELRRLDADQH